MEDKFLVLLLDIISKCEIKLEMNCEFSIEDENSSGVISDLPIVDCYSVVLNSFKDDYTADQRKSIRQELLSYLKDIPSMALNLTFLKIKKFNFSILPISETVSEVLVYFTDHDNVKIENVKKINAIIGCLDHTEKKNKEYIKTIEYRLFRMLVLLSGIGCQLGACYLADLILTQFIIEEEGVV